MRILGATTLLTFASPAWAAPDHDKTAPPPKAARDDAPRWLSTVGLDEGWLADRVPQNVPKGLGFDRSRRPPNPAGGALPGARNRANAPIPEPASALLLLVGSLILGTALRRAD